MYLGGWLIDIAPGFTIVVWVHLPVRSFVYPSQQNNYPHFLICRLFGQQMFAALGMGGGNSLLAGLAIVLGIPFPVWIWYRGEAIRAKSNLTR